jgi:signal transduction histidine kinase
MGRGDLAKERSFGIRGLHERAATVGGWVDLASPPGGGTSLILTVPLAQDAIDALDDSTDFGKDDPNSIWGRV